jgi:hypothetical protein
MTTYATSGTDEDGTMWVSPGGPEHLTMLRDELKGVRELLPLGGSANRRTGPMGARVDSMRHLRP